MILNDNVNESGVLGGRGVGLLINMFMLNVLLELDKRPILNVVLIGVSIVLLLIHRKNIKAFWMENIWKKEFYWIFGAFNIMSAGILGGISCIDKNMVFLETDEIGILTRLGLLLMYIGGFMLSELPNSFIINFASKNEKNWQSKSDK